MPRYDWLVWWILQSLFPEFVSTYAHTHNHQPWKHDPANSGGEDGVQMYREPVQNEVIK